jgi:hypothetical protein
MNKDQNGNGFGKISKHRGHKKTAQNANKYKKEHKIQFENDYNGRNHIDLTYLDYSHGREKEYKDTGHNSGKRRDNLEHEESIEDRVSWEYRDDNKPGKNRNNYRENYEHKDTWNKKPVESQRRANDNYHNFSERTNTKEKRSFYVKKKR